MLTSKKSATLFGAVVTILCLAGAGYVYISHRNESSLNPGVVSSSSGNAPATNPATGAAAGQIVPSAPPGSSSGADANARGAAVRPLGEAPDPLSDNSATAGIAAPPSEGTAPDQDVPSAQTAALPDASEPFDIPGDTQGPATAEAESPDPDGQPATDAAGAPTPMTAEADPSDPTTGNATVAGTPPAGQTASVEAPGSATGESTGATVNKAPGATTPAGATSDTAVIVYGRGKSLTPGGHAVAGDVPAQAPAVNLKTLYEGKATAEDGIVRMEFINDFAVFLAENYWPAGTHPSARTRAASTAGVKWANLKYGAHLQGFGVSKRDPATARKRVLEYVLMPSMINGLYSLYSERFITALNREAARQTRSRKGAAFRLTSEDIAGMYGIYAQQARSLAGAVRSYYSSPRNAERVVALIQAEEAASVAGQKFHEALIDKSDSAQAARVYQTAVMRREQSREAVASSLRMGGSTQGLDTDSLVYVALWLHRRSAAHAPAVNTLAQALDRCADRFDQERTRIIPTI